MDWLFWPLFFLGLFTFVFGVHGSKNCSFENCSSTFNADMEASNLNEPEHSPEYCENLVAYKKCLKQQDRFCRGNLGYHGTWRGVDRLHETFCSKSAQPGGGPKDPGRPNFSTTTTRQMLPSCRYFGTFKFRHCGLYGDPHLKTFGGTYQTCRVRGNWTLIDNPYMLVEVTSDLVTTGSHATAPVKIRVVVKGRDTPCTLEKTYEASSEAPLPNTFTDGTDKSGADRTVTLEISSNPEEDRESVEIVMRYVASKLMIRRKGKYLAFNAKLPEEVIQTAKTFEDDSKLELCSTGCPAGEQLDLVSARGHQMEREEALKLCRNADNLSADIANNLTDHYLDWCVFDVMTAGRNRDFIDAAHSAQADALKLDPYSLQNRTTLLEIPYDSVKFNSATSFRYQLPFCISFSLIAFVFRIFS